MPRSTRSTADINYDDLFGHIFGYHAAHHAPSMGLYEEHEDLLRETLDSGRPFTAQGSCKKSEYLFTLHRAKRYGPLDVDVTYSLPSIADAAESLYYEVTRDEGDLSDEDYDAILDANRYYQETEDDFTTLSDPTLQDVYDALGTLEDIVSEEAEENWAWAVINTAQALGWIVPEKYHEFALDQGIDPGERNR